MQIKRTWVLSLTTGWIFPSSSSSTLFWLPSLWWTYLWDSSLLHSEHKERMNIRTVSWTKTKYVFLSFRFPCGWRRAVVSFVLTVWVWSFYKSLIARFLVPTASVCAVCTQSSTSEMLHSEEPLPVQVLVFGDLVLLWVHHVLPHHVKHIMSGDTGKLWVSVVFVFIAMSSMHKSFSLFWWKVSVWGQNVNILSAFQHCNQSDHVTKLSDTLNIIFTVLFTLEMIVKMIAYKIKVKC